MHTFMGPFSECCTKLRVWPCSAQAFRKCWSDCFKQWIINGLYRICRSDLDMWSCHHMEHMELGWQVFCLCFLVVCALSYLQSPYALLSPLFCLLILLRCLAPAGGFVTTTVVVWCFINATDFFLFLKKGKDLLMQFKSWKNWRSNLSAFRVRWCIAVR